MFPSERPSEWLWRLLPETCLRRCHTSMMEFFVKVVLLTSMYSWHCSGVYTVNFEQVNVGWVFWIIRHQSHKEFLLQKELDPETSFTRFCNVSKMLWMPQLSFDLSFEGIGLLISGYEQICVLVSFDKSVLQIIN